MAAAKSFGGPKTGSRNGVPTKKDQPLGGPRPVAEPSRQSLKTVSVDVNFREKKAARFSVNH